jgi:type I restriction enzyme S subunit
VRVPGLAVQRRIGAILAAFDQLIAINERRNELLEDLARSLYREWFGRMRFPGHDEARLVSTPIGRVPADWQVGSLAQILR